MVISPGTWTSFHAHEASLLIFTRWMTLVGGVNMMHSMLRLHMEGFVGEPNVDRATALFPEERYDIPFVMTKVIEDVVNFE